MKLRINYSYFCCGFILIRSYYHHASGVLAIGFCLSLAQAQVQSYNISTVAGNGTSGYTGDGGPATSAELSSPCGIAVDSSGNLYIADQSNNRIREAVVDANINTVVGNGTQGYTGDGGAATSAEINLPCGVFVDAAGDIFFTQTDSYGTTDSAVRKVSGGNVTTLAGGNSTMPLGPGYSGDGGPAVDAAVNSPLDVKVDSAGNVYIADTSNSAIREITTNGNIQTIVGGGRLNRPEGIALDAAGNLYIADTFNYCVRQFSNGSLTTVAGSCGNMGYSGDNGPATSALLNYPTGVAVDGADNIYIVDSYNFRIREVAASNGNIYTIAGNGSLGAIGDGGAALDAEFDFPFSIALGQSGAIYIGDQQNNEIRALTPVAGVPSIDHAQSVTSCGAFPAASAPGAWIEIYGSNLAVGTRPWAASDFNGSVAPTSLDGTSVNIGSYSAVISYISPGQVNAQVPLNVETGVESLSVTNSAGTSGTYPLTINATEPGLCQGLTVNGDAYIAAVVNNTTTYILPSSANASGVTFRPAQPGEVLNFFGNGFGAVTPAPPQGQTVSQLNSLTNALVIQIGGVNAQIEYAGLAPGAIGLYQFNVVVPSNAPTGDQVPVTFTLNGVAGTQTLYTAIQSSQ
jgi:uncharacterized protein (TIGR03437 family)